jgi:transposase/biotin operon repressor
MVNQPMLLPMPEAMEREVGGRGKAAQPGVPRLKEPNRKQFVMDSFDLEKLIPSGHLARGIWALVESLPTEGFLKENKSVEGHAGRPRTSPKMLLAMWVYSYSQGIGEARAIEKEMEYEPGLRWLAGNALLSFRTLSDFRVAHGDALRETFAELLGILEKEEWIDLAELTLDGTKVKANAGSSSRRREKTLREHIAKAVEVVQALEQKEAAAEIGKRQTAARKRAAEERHERLKKAALELEEIRKSKKEAERKEARVSLTDPEARLMKDGHGGYALSYNVQVLTETKNKIVTNIAVTQQANDQQQFAGAVERLKEAQQLPERIIVDGGYTTAANIRAAQEQGLDLIGPELDLTKQQVRNCAQSLKRAGIAVEFGPAVFFQIEEGKALQCPAGKRLELKQISKEYRQYVSTKSDCAGCPHQAQCSPKGQRYVKVRQDNQTVQAYTKKMRESANQERYKKRGEVAEFPHAWWKDKLKLRQFHVRGRVKVEIEMWWAALTYNIQQWFRLSWRPKLALAATA